MSEQTSREHETQALQHWIARLSGSQASLDYLLHAFTWPHTITKDEEGYFLTSSDLASCTALNEAWRIVDCIIDEINLVAGTSRVDFQPVASAGQLISVDTDGKRQRNERVVIGAARIVVRGYPVTLKVIRADGTFEVASPEQLSADELLALLRSEGADAPLKRALSQWNLPKTPTSLNNVLETMRDDVAPGKAQRWERMTRVMAAAINTTDTQLSRELRRCRDSLNNPKSVGPLARHGNPKPVNNPMSLDAAARFVGSLLKAWLREKIRPTDL